jgi:hypothetical protein
VFPILASACKLESCRCLWSVPYVYTLMVVVAPAVHIPPSPLLASTGPSPQSGNTSQLL